LFKNLSARYLQLFLSSGFPDINTIQMCYCIATNWRQMTPTSLRRRRPDSSPLCARPWAQTCHPGAARTLLQPRIMRANSQTHSRRKHVHAFYSRCNNISTFSPKRETTRYFTKARSARVMRFVLMHFWGVWTKNTQHSRQAPALSEREPFRSSDMCIFESRPSGRDEYMGLLWRRSRLPVAVKCQLASAPSTEGWSFY
jgi:hypothetical protein